MKTYENLIDHHELAARILDLPVDITTDEVEDEVFEKLEIEFHLFAQLVDDLLPFAYPLVSPMTNRVIHTFGHQDGGAWLAIVKREARLPSST